MAYYSCQLGWRLEGFEKRACKADGDWTPDPPLCIETLCKVSDGDRFIDDKILLLIKNV